MRNFLKENKSFAVGALSLTLAAFLTKVLGVLFKVPMSYILTDEGMGYFNSAYTVYGFFYVISTAGVPKAVAMLKAEFICERDSNESHSLYKYILIRLSAIGLLITILFIIMAPLLSDFIGSTQSLYTMLAIAPTIFFVTAAGVVRGHLNSEGRLMPIALSQLIEAGGKLLVGIAFAYIGKSLNLSLPQISALSVLGITLSSVFSAIYLLICAKPENVATKVRQTCTIDKSKAFFRLLKYAIPITLSSSVLSLSGIIDTCIIIHGLEKHSENGIEAIALYGNYTTLSFPMLNLVTSVLAPISVAYLPKIRKSWVNGEDVSFNNNFSRALFIVSSFAAPCSFAYFFYAFELLDVLFTVYSAAIGAEMLIFLSPSVFLLSVLTVFNTGLEAMGKLHATLISLTLGSFFKLALSYLFITNLGLGILSAPLSTSLSYLLSLAITLGVLKRYQISVGYINNIFMPITYSFCVFTIVFSFIYLPFCYDKSSFWSIICVGLSFILYYFTLFSSVLICKYGKNHVKFNKKANNFLVNR